MRNLAIAAAVLSLTAPAFAGAPADFIGFSGSYAQNFDTLPLVNPVPTSLVGRGPHQLNTGFVIGSIPGWFGSNPAGSSSDTEFKAHNGSLAGSAGRGVLSLGTTDSTERALGALSTSNQINTFGIVFINDTTSPIDSLDISFRGEQWRRGNIASTSPDVNSLKFTYSVFASNPGSTVIDDLRIIDPPTNPPSFTVNDSLTFSSPNRQDTPAEVALDGNDPANSRSLSSTLSGLNWAPNTFLALRWSARDITGQDDGLGIDDLLISVPTPSVVRGDFGGNESPDGSFNSPDGDFNDLDIEGFLLALNNQSAYLALNPTLSSSLVALGDFGGNESTDGSFNTPDGDFNDLDIEGFLLALNNPAGYAAIQPPTVGGVSAIPEPAALGLLAPMGLLLSRRRR